MGYFWSYWYGGGRKGCGIDHSRQITTGANTKVWRVAAYEF